MVQVKTPTWNTASKYHYLQCRTASDTVMRYTFDYLFLVNGLDMWEIPYDAIDTTNLCLKSTNPNGKISKWESYKIN